MDGEKQSPYAPSPPMAQNPYYPPQTPASSGPAAANYPPAPPQYSEINTPYGGGGTTAYGMPQQQPPPSVIVQGPTVTVPPTRVVYQTNFRFGTQPVEVTCPACNARVLTRIDKSYGPGAFLLSGLCICVGCWLGCCLIPFAMDDCKVIVHSCPNCKAMVGKHPGSISCA